MILWRISNYADLSGEGGRRFSPRRHTMGKPIIYATESPAAALSEILVHLGARILPDNFQLLKIAVPDTIPPLAARPKGNWVMDEAITRKLAIPGWSSAKRFCSACLPPSCPRPTMSRSIRCTRILASSGSPSSTLCHSTRD